MSESIRICKYNFGEIVPGILSANLNFKIKKILDTQLQYHDLVIWAEVDTNIPMDEGTQIYVKCVWTGVTPPKSDSSEYLKTITDIDGLVYHVYRVFADEEANDCRGDFQYTV